MSSPSHFVNAGSGEAIGLTFDDFVLFYAASFKNLSSAQEMKEAFRLLDNDSDGLVEFKRVQQAMAAMQPALPADELREMMSEAVSGTAASTSATGRGGFRDILLGHVNFEQFMHFLFS